MSSSNNQPSRQRCGGSSQQLNRSDALNTMRLQHQWDQKRNQVYGLMQKSLKMDEETEIQCKKVLLLKQKFKDAIVQKRELIKTFNSVCGMLPELKKMEQDIEEKCSVTEAYINNLKEVDEQEADMIRQLKAELKEGGQHSNAELDSIDKELEDIDQYLAENDDVETLQQKDQAEEAIRAKNEAEIRAARAHQAAEKLPEVRKPKYIPKPKLRNTAKVTKVTSTKYDQMDSSHSSDPTNIGRLSDSSDSP